MTQFEEILGGDEFINNLCIKCSTHSALFATPVWFVACPSCLADRLGHLLATGTPVPWWIQYLHGATRREVVHQSKRKEQSLSVAFDDFYKCDRCGRLIQQSDARYHFPAGARSSPPYCVGCWEQLERDGSP